MKNARWRMNANPGECRVCYMCQLICSLKQEKVFNPERACIDVSSSLLPDGSRDITIAFGEKCDSCGLCAKYCTYGALQREKLEA